MFMIILSRGRMPFFKITFQPFINYDSRGTAHSLEEVEKYLLDCRRVKYCLLKGLDEERICFVLKMSRGLAREDIEIINEVENRDLEKELEIDLLDCKITLGKGSESVLDDSELGY